jgi:hypothetical protein
MSTVLSLEEHERATPPRLRRFHPQFKGNEGERRKMTLVPDLFDWLDAQVKGESLNRVKAQARTHFGQFVKGEPIDDLFFMKRVEDRRCSPPSLLHEVWSISPRFPPPQYRYFGFFVSQDWFLVCSKQTRDRLGEHDNRWHVEIDKARKIWARLFGSNLPHKGSQLYHYVSHNAVHCDDRW